MQNFVNNFFFDKSKIEIIETTNETNEIIVDNNFKKNYTLMKIIMHENNT